MCQAPPSTTKNRICNVGYVSYPQCYQQHEQCCRADTPLEAVPEGVEKATDKQDRTRLISAHAANFIPAIGTSLARRFWSSPRIWAATISREATGLGGLRAGATSLAVYERGANEYHDEFGAIGL
jgi:hypothetical protein